MAKHVTPADLFGLWMRGAQMMAEANMVIALRLMGMAGLWRVSAGENDRMVAEKAPALIAAATAAQGAALAGKRPDQIMKAAVIPLGRKTRSNVRRLSRRGPKLP